jgi:hypothetical protein
MPTSPSPDDGHVEITVDISREKPLVGVTSSMHGKIVVLKPPAGCKLFAGALFDHPARNIFEQLLQDFDAAFVGMDQI